MVEKRRKNTQYNMENPIRGKTTTKRRVQVHYIKDGDYNKRGSRLLRNGSTKDRMCLPRGTSLLSNTHKSNGTEGPPWESTSATLLRNSLKILSSRELKLVDPEFSGCRIPITKAHLNRLHTFLIPLC